MSPQAELLALTPEQKTAYRRRMERDPWYFSKYVCKRDAKAERHHRPLLYLYTRRAHLLCACLDDPKYDGPITQQIRADFEAHGINWRDPAHLPRVQQRLRRVNVRMPRSSGKSTFADDGDLWEATIDPDITISIGSKSDPYAWKRISTIGQFVLSPEYAFWFPDRVPDDVRNDVTEKAIWLKGRTRHVPEATIEGRGLNSQWFGNHYRKNRRDDIVGTESGEASLEDGLKHLAQMTALRDLTGWVGDVFIGTINGEEDDHTMLAADEGVLTVIVPIEEHEGGTTLENIYTDGTLLMPEWFDRDTVNQIKAEAKSNPKYGAIWLLQNHYMAAHKTGVAAFTARLISRAKYRVVYDSKLKRELIARPKKEREDTQRDPTHPNFKPEDWTYIDLSILPRTAFAIGIDQSIAEDASSDRWAQVCVAIDPEGVFYVLDSIADHGYPAMLAEIVPFDRKHKHPAYIGIDANATQGMTVEWLKRSDEFKAIARRVKEVRSNSERKDINIRNWVQARMLTGELYVNPTLHDWINEALKYRPKKPDGTRNKNPKDDQLDATWMAMTLPRVPPAVEVIEEMEEEAAMKDVIESAKRNPITGQSTDSWLDALSGWSAA